MQAISKVENKITYITNNMEKNIFSLRQLVLSSCWHCWIVLHLPWDAAEKIHWALPFDQNPWMEPYIRMNMDLQKGATSDFEKDL